MGSIEGGGHGTGRLDPDAVRQTAEAAKRAAAAAAKTAAAAAAKAAAAAAARQASEQAAQPLRAGTGRLSGARNLDFGDMPWGRAAGDDANGDAHQAD